MRVKDAPFEMGNEIMLNIISKYGKVEGVRLNKYTTGPAAGLLKGTRTFKVNLKNNIPSSVTVGGHSLTFLYAGQRKTCYKCGHEGHLAIDCHTEEIDKVNIFNEENFPVIQLSGEIHSSRAGVKEGVESVTVSQVPATTRHGVEREEVPVQTISQDAVDPDGTTHPDCSENAAQETSSTCEAEIHTERNNVDQTKGYLGTVKTEAHSTSNRSVLSFNLGATLRPIFATQSVTRCDLHLWERCGVNTAEHSLKRKQSNVNQGKAVTIRAAPTQQFPKRVKIRKAILVLSHLHVLLDFLGDLAGVRSRLVRGSWPLGLFQNREDPHQLLGGGRTAAVQGGARLVRTGRRFS
ncbi:hypothetical protein Hamer_G000157 [Homarus americanus]|uniref:CCHC-type domain-containing protein n=1 Tax=Homarus americanus TaxID=6706 RepID=A0A8J5NAG1_HOMAM|nr:hypothetical protein Hamer_G000157 [Homarus americanus]